jgi:hypothetical protein
LFFIVDIWQSGAEDEQRGKVAAPAITERVREPPGLSAAPEEPDLAASEPATNASAAEALRSIAGALPHTDLEAQRLRLIEVRALLAQGRPGAARARAYDYFDRWPDGPDVAALEALTGAHPTR